ncbi:MAG: CD225/dispanin family protein [Porphyromonas sp.]|uniref:CD225/dispanin family protein n=1 Tax=Porphyromonas sp. TaxID=1924944 RepID=UPI002A75D8DC|nr:CD225/dispanin family protein [Porphyromonas sp.]MDD6928642.1 CD225/dispanin family protein [Bacteroidales bacterium]MDY3111091.1 CD225/dispanin family protein [Porphyromonas sp.]MDY4246197.1 CD225/dispanin family protein [Porphyromonas sp.]
MKLYYIVHNGQELGPYTLEELSARGITPETMIRIEGVVNACPAQALDELRPLFGYQAPGPNPYAGTPAYGTPYGYGSHMQPQNRPVMPPDNLVWSILCVIFFFPLGIIPLVYSIQVSTHYDRGNYAEAENASRKSLQWARGLAIAAAVCIGISIAIFVAIAIAATSAVSAAL